MNLEDASPRPWVVNGHSIEANDPDGLWLKNEKTGRGVVANLPSCPKSRMSKKNREGWNAIVEANAELIVRAVNEFVDRSRKRKFDFCESLEDAKFKYSESHAEHDDEPGYWERFARWLFERVGESPGTSRPGG